jgi:hypothetical protein
MHSWGEVHDFSDKTLILVQIDAMLSSKRPASPGYDYEYIPIASLQQTSKAEWCVRGPELKPHRRASSGLNRFIL